MQKVINSISVIGWGYLLLKIGLQIFINRDEYLASDISFDVMVLKVIQLFQIMDIVLIVLGKSKGSLLGAFFQILGRNIVSLIFISEESDRLRFATVVIIWAMADINRYMYYLFKDNALTGFLRYNSFILLYPIGVFGEMMIINNFIKLNSEWLLDQYIYLIRFVQFCIVLGMILIYIYMLKSRAKYLKGLEKLQAQLAKKQGSQTSVKEEKSAKKERKSD